MKRRTFLRLPIAAAVAAALPVEAPAYQSTLADVIETKIGDWRMEMTYYRIEMEGYTGEWIPIRRTSAMHSLDVAEQEARMLHYCEHDVQLAHHIATAPSVRNAGRP